MDVLFDNVKTKNKQRIRELKSKIFPPNSNFPSLSKIKMEPPLSSTKFWPLERWRPVYNGRFVQECEDQKSPRKITNPDSQNIRGFDVLMISILLSSLTFEWIFLWLLYVPFNVQCVNRNAVEIKTEKDQNKITNFKRNGYG